MITVYTTGPLCQKCNATKRALTKVGLEYREIRVDGDDEALEQLRANGFASAPVVEARTPDGVDRWDDFRPDRIKALAAKLAE